MASAERAAAIEIARRGKNCSVVCEGCGCKGDPGYRNSKGKCVSFKRLIKECGPPPHSRCIAECTPVVKGCD